ncbi:MAG: hypothetical protein HY319_14855 [Armatimonadetes bacterium]|nr:hypothetical protein [Armatimonadota bacterium]
MRTIRGCSRARRSNAGWATGVGRKASIARMWRRATGDTGVVQRAGSGGAPVSLRPTRRISLGHRRRMSLRHRRLASGYVVTMGSHNHKRAYRAR